MTSSVVAQSNDLHFAWLSDTHVGNVSGESDLRRTVQDLNSQSNLAFVIISGDITQLGKRSELTTAKSILDQLRIPYHVEPGNHDCKWSESGATDFARIFGFDRFVFDAGGYTFIGMHEGPVLKMGDGHFAPQDVRWLSATLAGLPKDQPIIFVTHYPIRDELDNWFVVLDELKKYNIQAILVGHGHHNEKLNFEGVPAAMGRSNLKLLPAPSGYNLVDITNGMLTLTERDPGRGTRPTWHSITLEKHDYASGTNHWPRPDFSINAKYPDVSELWQFDAKFTMAASPVVDGSRVFVGDASGAMRALSVKTGEVKWRFDTGSAVYSTPAVEGHRLVFASTDGHVYALKTSNGEKLWDVDTKRTIVASPSIVSNVVYIGASDGQFRALDVKTGKQLWSFPGVRGFVETRPLVTDNEVIFGAWDEYLYALNATNGRLLWKWKGNSPGNPSVPPLMYSPAAMWPVAARGKVFVVAPDRFMTALNLNTGKQVWRTNEWQVRESEGISEDGSRVYVRTMTNTAIVAIATTPSAPQQLWELKTDVSYDINSAMLVEKDGILYYGTKNGVLLAVDSRSGTLLWEHKLGMTILNTIAPLDEPNELIVCDLDGKVTRVGPRQH